MTRPERVGRDPGRQPERTRLAWRRTALAQGVVAILVVRLGLIRGSTGGAVVAAVVLVGWAALVVLGYTRHRPGRAGSGEPPGPVETGGAALTVSALATVGFAVIGMILVLHPTSH